MLPNQKNPARRSLRSATHATDSTRSGWIANNPATRALLQRAPVIEKSAAIRIAFRPIAGPCAGRARVARVWRLADPFDMAHLPSQAAPVLYARAPEVLWDLSIAPVRSMDDKTGFRRVENPPSHLTPAR